MQEMDAAVSEAIEATGRVAGSLRINTLGMAARQFIAPRLGRFHRAYPQVVLDIVIDDTLSDIVAGHFDAGICVGKRLEKDMIAVRLSPDVKMVAVASPDRAWRAQVRFDGMVDDAPWIVPLSPKPAFASSRASCLHQLSPGTTLTD